MEKIQWKVEGMDCSNCALTIRKYLEKEGMQDVKVNFATGDVSFDINGHMTAETMSKGVHDLGYQVIDRAAQGHGHEHGEGTGRGFLRTHLQRFWFCLPFTAILMLHMIPGLHGTFLMNPWLQMGLTVPVFIVGMSFFGKSAWKSLRNGLPNMNVLIAVGAVASFGYSLYGTLSGQAANYMFYETTATIITLVFLGNYMEEASVRSTQRELNKLVKSQKIMANMIAYDDEHTEHVFPVENTALRTGDLILIKSGEQVPSDCKILWGEAHVNEALITGESTPVRKVSKDKLIGGSLLSDGTVKAQVTAVGDDTVLAGIINMVKEAQGEKPPVQQLADKISAVFVPLVLGIAAVTLIVNWIVLEAFPPALLRSIAVLVIACPCAMGLATPAAIAVGLGRAARKGVLFRNATSLELFKDIRQAVFDKTGTLTIGELTLHQWKLLSPSIDENEFKRIVFSLEKYSNHHLARCITKEWKTKDEMRWTSIEEVKGLGMIAKDREGNVFRAIGLSQALGRSEPGMNKDLLQRLHDLRQQDHQDEIDIVVTKNDELLGWINMKDELRPEAKQVIDYLHSKNIQTFLLSGDRLAKCQQIANQLGIDQVIAEQSPEQKMTKIAELSSVAPTVMVGDGINDAPALAKATVGISMGDASQIAMQSAPVVLMNQGLKKLPLALGLGKHTYITIKENLFWAFAYNIVAIPVAALGFLTPTFGALVMGLSDVVLAINSARLYVKKVE